MRKVIAIYARSKDGFIARSSADKLSWTGKADKKRFKRVTMGSTLIMGRKTYELCGDLPGRSTIVMSRSKKDGVYTDKIPEDVLSSIEGDVYICGGLEIYKLFKPFVTHVDESIIGVELGEGILAPDYFGLEHTCNYF